jgi:hypothetical protein
MLRECGYDTVTERRLFALHLALPSDFPARVGLPPGNFVCLLAWDARGVPVDVVSTLVERLLTAGACYFVCWGPDCERVHDIIDEIDADPRSELGAPDGSVIMTTWHSREPLSEALWFFLRWANPDDHYYDSTRSAMAVSIGSEAWAAELSAALADPDDFVSRGCEIDGA